MKYIVWPSTNTVLLIVLFSVIYAGTNPLLSSLARNPLSSASVFIILSVATMVLERYILNKFDTKTSSNRMLIANAILVMLTVLALISNSVTPIQQSVSQSVKNVSTDTYLFALFLHVFLIKYSCLLFPLRFKKNVKNKTS